MKTIWSCKIGFAGTLPANANLVLASKGFQRAIHRKFKELVGKQADFSFFNPEATLTDIERSLVGDGPMFVVECKIGVHGNVALPDGADFPIRQRAAMMFAILFRTDPAFNFSGWNASLTESEQAFLAEKHTVSETN